MVQCLAEDNPDRVWPFCPSVVPAAMFALLFGVLTTVHLVQAIKYRKGYCWIIIMAALWQTATYVIREVSIYKQDNGAIYSVWFILILIAPLWTNAFVYMVLARMVWCFEIPDRKLGGIRAWRLGMIFVLLDIVAFVVQGTGASMASGEDRPLEDVMRGLHVYMVGVGAQQFFILLFTALLVRFHLRIKRKQVSSDSKGVLHLIYVLYTALALITVRIIFRLIEYSAGPDSAIPTHEAFSFIFETVPMFFAVLAFNVVHPGRIMPGRASDIPGRKKRRQMIKDGMLPGKEGRLAVDHTSDSDGPDVELVRRPDTPPSWGTVEGYELLERSSDAVGRVV